MGSECAFGFEDLFRAAKRRDMSDAERKTLEAASQDERNRLVREWVVESGGEFCCEDRSGSDGLIYTSFWAKTAQGRDGGRR